MSAQRGHEMRKYLAAISTIVVLLVVVVIVYGTVDSVQRIDREMKKEEERVSLLLVNYLKEALEETSSAGADPEIMGGIINPELLDSTDPMAQLRLLQFYSEVVRAQFAAEYLTYVSGGMVLASSTKEGLDITDFPTEMPADGYEILEELGGRQGTFIVVYRPIELSPLAQEEFINVAIDRTEDFEAVRDFYSEEKSDLVTRQVIIGIVALLVALLLTTIGVYLLTRRYITAPIAELADASHRIMEGSFEGEVKVVEESDYADIQRLLQSGKVLMEKMANEADDV